MQSEPTTKTKLMNRKINMFTLMIFAYSIVICATFKKGHDTNPLSTAKANVQPVKVHKPVELNPEKVTVSAASITNPNQ